MLQLHTMLFHLDKKDYQSNALFILTNLLPIFTVAPIGNTNRVTRLSNFKFSSKHRKVTGNDAALSKFVFFSLSIESISNNHCCLPRTRANACQPCLQHSSIECKRIFSCNHIEDRW